MVYILGDGYFPVHSLYYIDMELCDLTLDDWIKRENWPESSERDSPFLDEESSEGWRKWQVLCILGHIAGGTAHIHRHALVHRDLKPSNSKQSG